MTPPFDTVIFDLDGTLYDEARIYDRYAEELARFLTEGDRDTLIRQWGEIKIGSGPRLVGRGYDENRGLLFSHASGRFTGYLSWDGEPISVDHLEQGGTAAATDVPDREPGSLFADGRVNIGDWWGVLAVLGARHGIGAQDRQSAFHATRAYMSGEGRLPPAEAIRPVLHHLRTGGLHLIAMSNSPGGTVVDTFEQLGIADCFEAIVAEAAKPAGLERFLEGTARPDSVISVGDNFVNDIEPALAASARALYIDRHDTGLGSDHDRCLVVPTMEAAFEWLRSAVP